MKIKTFFSKYKIALIISIIISLLFSLYGTFIGVYNLGNCKGGPCNWTGWYLIFLKQLIVSFIILTIISLIVSYFIKKRK